MKTYAPNYYEKFRCIAGECRHSCCIGWDVYIDDDTLEKYASMGGELGKRVRSSLCEKDDGACFAMCADGRCPFLNERGLCDIILEKGEESISEICTEHPRFYNFFSDRTEVGLGLSCEEAARIILSQKEKTERIKNVITYIRKNYATHVTLDDLAEAVGVNREYLCREFKTTIGMSPINFLIDYRIEQSKKILLSPKGTVTEAALASGFSDISYYIKKFTAHNGCTPLQFRKQRINDN